MKARLVALAIVGSFALGGLLVGCGSDGGGGPQVKLSAAGERGKVVAKEQGCISCHTADGSKSIGPSWKGLAGSKVELDDGTTLVADDDYLRRSILFSRGQVVDGYANTMPVYDGEISDADLADLLAYLHDLSPVEADGGATGSGSTGG